MLRRTIFAVVFHLVVVFSRVTVGFSPVSPLKVLIGQRRQQQQHAPLFPTFSTTPSYSPLLRCPVSLRYANTAADAPPHHQHQSATADNRHLDSPNPWIVLGLMSSGASSSTSSTPSPSIDEIKRRYKQLAKLHHPDQNPNASPEEKQMASERFCKINSAYEKAVSIVAAKTTAAAARAAKQQPKQPGGGGRTRGSGSPFGNTWSSTSSTTTNHDNHYTQHRHSPPPPPPPRSAHTTTSTQQQTQRQQAWYSHTAAAGNGPYQQPQQQSPSASSSSYTQQQQQQQQPPHNNRGANAAANGSNNRAWYEPYGTSTTVSSGTGSSSSSKAAGSSGFGWENNNPNGYSSSSRATAGSSGFGWENNNPNGYSSPSSSSSTPSGTSRTTSSSTTTTRGAAAAQSDFSSSSQTTTNQHGRNKNPSSNTASSSSFPKSARHASTTTTAGGWPKSSQQSYTSYTSTSSSTSPSPSTSTTTGASTPAGTAASPPSRNGYGAASSTSGTTGTSTTSQGWTNPFKAGGSQQGYSATTSGGGGANRGATGGGASTTSKTTQGWTTQPHQSPKDFGFHHGSNAGNNPGTAASSTSASPKNNSGSHQTPKDFGFQKNERTTTSNDAATKKSATTSAHAAPTSTKSTGWAANPHHTGSSGTYASSTTTTTSVGTTSTSRTGTARATSSESGPKTSKNVAENKKVKIDLSGGGSDQSSFAQAYLARFGRVAKNAATGEVFDDLVVFLDHHLKADMSKSSLHEFLRTGNLEQVGKELDDMELLVQSLSTLFKSIQDEVVKVGQQKNVELEKRKELVTSYLALARKRLSTVTSRYWELVWDKSRGAPASPSTSTAAERSSSSPSTSSQATGSSTTVSTTTTSSAGGTSTSNSYNDKRQNGSRNPESIEYNGGTATTSSRSAPSSPASSDTKSTFVNNDNKKDIWKPEGLGSARSSSNGNAPSTSTTGSVKSSSSSSKKADDWLKKAFESFSGLKELQEKLGTGSSKDNENDNINWRPKGFGSFGRTATASTATASSSPVGATTTTTSSSKDTKTHDWLKRGVDSLSGLKENLQERLGQRGTAADNAATRSVEVEDAEWAGQNIPDFLKKSTASESAGEEVNDGLKRSVDSSSGLKGDLYERSGRRSAAAAAEASTRSVEAEDAEWVGQKIPDFLKKSTTSEFAGEEINVDSMPERKDVQEILGPRGAAEVSTRFMEVEDAEWVGPKMPDFLKKSMASEVVAEKVKTQGILNKFKRQEKSKNKMEIRCVPMGTNRIDFSDVIKKNNPAFVDYLEQELQARKIAVPTNKDGTPSFAKMKKSLKDWVASKDKQAKFDPKLLNSFTPKRQELWGELLFTGNKSNNWTSPSDVADRDEMFFVFLMGVWRR